MFEKIKKLGCFFGIHSWGPWRTTIDGRFMNMVERDCLYCKENQERIWSKV